MSKLKLNYEGLRVLNHGLSAQFKFNKFKLMKFMQEDTTATPMGLLTAMNERAKKETVWFRPDFFIQDCKINKTITNNFMVGSRLMPTKNFYRFLETGIESVNRNTKMVTLKKWVHWKIDVTYIGSKIFTLHDTFTTDDGELLGTIDMSYENHNADTRRLDPISDSGLQKLKYIKTNNIKPFVPKILEIPTHIPTYTIDHLVSKTGIDVNNHANFSYYVDLGINAFHQVTDAIAPVVDKHDKSKVEIGSCSENHMHHRNDIEEFGVLYRNECVLGDVVQSTAWIDVDTGCMYCHLTRGGDILTFIHAKSNICTDNSKQSRL